MHSFATLSIVSPSDSSELTQKLSQRLDHSIAAAESLRESLPNIAEMANLLIRQLQAGATIYTCGNGGSAAQALHLAEELIGRYRGNRQPLRSVCLNADPTALTCIANDFGFDQVFARQCEALLRPGDVLMVFSTSGNSANLIHALKVARAKRAITIGLLGKNGGLCRELCDHAIVLSGTHDSAHIQDAHQIALHLVCEAIEQAACGGGWNRSS